MVPRHFAAVLVDDLHLGRVRRLAAGFDAAGIWPVEGGVARRQQGHRFAQPTQRWYPGRHLAGPLYVHQWIDDFRAGCAGARTRDELADPRFFRWLVERGYARGSELASLQEWLASKPPRIQLHIRPGIEARRTWPYADAFAPDGKDEFVAEVREAIDRVLSALDEPKLNLIRPT